MRQQWIPLFVLTILLLTCLSFTAAQYETKEKKLAWFATTENAVAAAEAYEEYQKKKEDGTLDDEAKDEDAQNLKQYMYYGAIGGCSVSAVINAIFFILACKGCICKPKQAPTHQTLDVL